MVDMLDLLRRNPVQLVAIGIVLAIVIGVFAYVAGYLTSHRLSVSVPHLENLRDAKEQSEILFEAAGHGDIVANGQHALPRGPEVLGITQPELLFIGLRPCTSTGEHLSAAECAGVADRYGRLCRCRHRVPHLRGYIASDPYISAVGRILAQTLVTRAGLVVIAVVDPIT